MVNMPEVTNAYFGAANGFDGFRSNFKEIFNPKDYTKIYILKGGPGTGKSTLMKEVAKYFGERKCEITAILCSSDPESLDGIIVESSGRRIGIVDGTAPHVVEAEFPGAVEEIINLADGFDFKELMRRKDEVLEFNVKKSDEYKLGYKHLKLCGEIFKIAYDELSNNDCYHKAEQYIEGILSEEKHNEVNRITSEYHLSSFGKNGYSFIENSRCKKQRIHIGADEIFRCVIMNALHNRLALQGVGATLFSSPLSNKIIDVVETENTIYIADNSSGAFSISASSEYEDLLKMYRHTLRLARMHFASAAGYHFALEDIYSANVSFKNNDMQIRKICEESEKLLLQ